MRLLVVVLALAIGAASLVGSAVGAEPFKRHAIRGQGLSLSVPASWVAVDASLPPATIARLQRDNPKLAPYFGQLGAAGSPAKFLALVPRPEQSFATNVNVVVTAIPSVTFEQYRAALVAEIRSIVGSAPIGQSVAKIHGAQAVRLSYRLEIRVGRSFTVQTLQYAFPRGGRSIVVTYTTLPSLKARYAGTFARSAASIRFAS